MRAVPFLLSLLLILLGDASGRVQTRSMTRLLASKQSSLKEATVTLKDATVSCTTEGGACYETAKLLTGSEPTLEVTKAIGGQALVERSFYTRLPDFVVTAGKGMAVAAAGVLAIYGLTTAVPLLSEMTEGIFNDEVLDYVQTAAKGMILVTGAVGLGTFLVYAWGLVAPFVSDLVMAAHLVEVSIYSF